MPSVFICVHLWSKDSASPPRAALLVHMADLRDKLPENAPGRFYVDGQCIDCDVCRDTAPDNFVRCDDNGYSFLYKQPENEEEFGLCNEAADACPVEAIGNDGDEANSFAAWP